MPRSPSGSAFFMPSSTFRLVAACSLLRSTLQGEASQPCPPDARWQTPCHHIGRTPPLPQRLGPHVEDVRRGGVRGRHPRGRTCPRWLEKAVRPGNLSATELPLSSHCQGFYLSPSSRPPLPAAMQATETECKPAPIPCCQQRLGGARRGGAGSQARRAALRAAAGRRRRWGAAEAGGGGAGRQRRWRWGSARQPQGLAALAPPLPCGAPPSLSVGGPGLLTSVGTLFSTQVTIYHHLISQAGWNRCNLSLSLSL